MCHLSPTVHLAWAVLSCGLQIILIQHLWRYDRFKCLRWSGGRQPGAFKRVMTYSYFASIPLLLVYSVSMTYLKYKNGYSFIPGHGIVPTPYQLWPQSDQARLFPLYVVFSIVWGLELVTHLEELTFWLFLLHQGPQRQDWFSSLEFKTWAFTSLIAVVGMPLTAIFTRANPINSEAWIFLAGSSASTSVTTVFFIVLAKFPAFLRRVKKEGAARPVVLRLVTFHELNIMRVIFRLLFTLPLLALGIDGVMHQHTLNENALWSDLLAFVAAVGTVVSSTLTLLIFFPRSLAEDSNWRPRSTGTGTRSQDSFVSGDVAPASVPRTRCSLENPFNNTQDAPPSSNPMLSKSKTKYYSGHFTSPSALTTTYYPPSPSPSPAPHAEWELREIEEGDMGQDEEGEDDKVWPESDEVQRDGSEERRSDGERRRDTQVRMMELANAVDSGLKRPVRPPRLHPYITTFTSPIDLMDTADSQADETVPRAI